MYFNNKQDIHIYIQYTTSGDIKDLYILYLHIYTYIYHNMNPQQI